MKTKKTDTARIRNLYIHRPACPNAADPRYFTDKMLNALTTVVSAMGFVTAMIFLVAIA